jgi:DNA-binding transcriptional regulator YdaS (Cro superfamily)
MLRVDYDRWGQRPDELRGLAVSSSHERTRERFLGLYEMSSGTSATGVAARIGRHPQSVMQWAYNSNGPGAYRRPSPLCPAIEAALGGVIGDAQQARPPDDERAPPPRCAV